MTRFSIKERARRNALIAALNTALARGIIGETDGENNGLQAGEARFPFDCAGIQFEGLLTDVGCGELRVAAFVRGPVTTRKKFDADINKKPLSSVPLGLGFDAVFSGWLVRRDPPGASLKNNGGNPVRYRSYLRNVGRSSCRSVPMRRVLADTAVEPIGDYFVER